MFKLSFLPYLFSTDKYSDWLNFLNSMSKNLICECFNASNLRHTFCKRIIEVQKYFGLTLPIKGYSGIQNNILFNVT